MGKMDEREKAFEKKYILDEETKFKVEARASKLFGLWAASKMGLEGDAARGYAAEVVSANLEEAGFDDVLRKVTKDFTAKNVTVPESEMRRELDKSVEEARKQVIPES